MSESIADWVITIAGLLHFAQVPSMRVARRALDWDVQLRRLGDFGRQLALLFGGGIMACVLGLGLVVVASHGQLLEEYTGRCLCAFLSLFWFKRALLQWTVLGASWPEALRLLHLGLCLLYPAMGGLYALGILSVVL